MHYFWSKFLVLFLVCEVTIFGVVYYFGGQGVLYLQQLKKQRISLVSHVTVLQSEIDDLKDTITQWEDGSFLQEKYAREKLHLQKENELIYFK